jgi:hypothetical protein
LGQCKFIDETGNRYGRLTVIERVSYEGKNVGAKWKCKCDCGGFNEVFGGKLRDGGTLSCGCIPSENRIKRTSNFRKKHKTSFKFEEDRILCTTHYNDVFTIDLDDYEKIKNLSWRFLSNGYVATGLNNTTVLLHRFILNAPSGYVVDHINHDKTDNRKSNLRICTYQENNRNKAKLESNTSGTTGVYYHKKTKKWRAQIGKNNNIICLGEFDDIEEAKIARFEAEDSIFKNYSYKNSKELM